MDTTNMDITTITTNTKVTTNYNYFFTKELKKAYTDVVHPHVKVNMYEQFKYNSDNWNVETIESVDYIDDQGNYIDILGLETGYDPKRITMSTEYNFEYNADHVYIKCFGEVQRHKGGIMTKEFQIKSFCINYDTIETKYMKKPIDNIMITTNDKNENLDKYMGHFAEAYLMFMKKYIQPNTTDPMIENIESFYRVLINTKYFEKVELTKTKERTSRGVIYYNSDMAYQYVDKKNNFVIHVNEVNEIEGYESDKFLYFTFVHNDKSARIRKYLGRGYK